MQPSFRTERRRALIATISVLALGIGTAVPAQASNAYPDQPIRIIVPYGPGGTGDVIARFVAKQLSQDLKHAVIVENKAGAAGSIGANYVANAAADGYTLLLAYTSEMVINPVIQKGVNYNVTRDFSPIALAGSTPLLLVSNPSVPVKDIDGLVKLAKDKPGTVTYATAGTGSPADIAGALLAKDAGIKIMAVPYKGGSQAVTDTVSGVVNIYFSGMPPAVPFVKSGKLNALGVTSTTPSPALPDVPALASHGYPRLDLAGWFGFFVPKGVANDRQLLLHDRILAALHAPEVQQGLAMQGVQTSDMSATAFGEFVQREQAKYGALIKELNISAE
ncbi:ABC transporter substrate-binding protein [Bordetella genomosp. 8]|uniref:ABC transporter substrate-binding protein n=1 Tax=Bordetella genomosp. 8 TaxID=1416806 RepID=A0A1W6YFI8_9BORD|nr:tripartite tricarboxylate transporter substrate binding protein [Bordetella genomosp. 8]ARP79866.1 ABC transporter substrate-binding protein [Bordetella genomosp. 8]